MCAPRNQCFWRKDGQIFFIGGTAMKKYIINCSDFETDIDNVKY